MASANSIRRTIQICRWRARVNALWLWAYCALTLALHGYLMYRAVSRCKDYNELPWRIRDKPVAELYAYISLIVLSVMCLPFFIITAIFTTGNYSGDGIRLGRDNIHQRELAEAAAVMSTTAADPDGADPNRDDDDDDDDDEVLDTTEIRTRSGGDRLRRLWRHVGAFSHGFHVVAAFALLIPSMFLEAQEIKYGFRDPDAAWHTDLDWLFGRRDYKIRQTPVDPVPHSTSADLTSPGSPDETLYNPPEGAMQVFDVRLPAPDVLSPEYVNYVAALVFYCVRYASVFWYTKMSFSLVFLGQLLVITFHFALSFCGAAILYKFQVNKTIFADLSLVLPSVATLALYVLGDVFLLTSTISVFNYGVQRYRDRWNKFLQEHAPRYWRRKRSRDSGDYPDYGPHAMASVMLLLVILCRGAIVYDYVIVYRKTGFPLILACIVMDAVYMVSWIAMWFAFTLKQNWNFRIMLARYVVATTSKATRSGGGAAKRESTSSGAASASAEKSDGCQLDGSTDVHNVGVLKKSKPKRKTSTQRVKFDESAENDVKDGNEAATDGEHGSRDTSGGERDGDGKNKATGAPSKLTNGNLRRVNSDSTSRHRRHGRQEDYLTESTPENTLTRNYRHSIRDQCGLYFRMSRDLSPAPAAHSSPVPFEKRQDRKAPAEIVLDPLGAARARPTNQKQATVNSVSDGTLSVSYSPDDSPATLLSCSNDSGVQLRRGNADRKLYPTRQDGRYSYPLACSPPDGWLYGRHSRGPPPPYVGREGIPIRHSLHLDRPSIPEDGRLVDKLPPIPWSPDTPARNSEGAPRANGQRTPSPPPRPPKKTQDYTNVYRSRDLKIIPKRPDRDSALPSSNETSSSDSNDVLCSQV